MKQLKTRQVCFFALAFIPVSKIFFMPSVMANCANQDMWLSVLFSFIVDFTVLSFCLYVCKKNNLTFFDLVENTFGKKGAKIVCFIFVIYFLLKAVLPLNEHKDYVELTLYTLMPTKLYFLPFFIVTFYFCTKKLNAIGRCVDILWIVTILGFLILISLSLSNADFTAILPVGVNGVKNILKGSYYSLNWFGDSLYILLFSGQFIYKKKDTAKIVVCYVISAILVIAFMIIFYCIFTSIAFRQRFALTEISKYTSVINNLGRFDYIGIFMILFSSIFSLSLPMFFASKLLDYIFNIKKRWISPLITVVSQFIIMVFFVRRVLAMERDILKYCGVFFFIMSVVLPIIICIFGSKKEIKNERTQN